MGGGGIFRLAASTGILRFFCAHRQTDPNSAFCGAQMQEKIVIIAVRPLALSVVLLGDQYCKQ